MRHEVYDGDARIAYVVEEVRGAGRLLVGFPGLYPGGAPPATGLRKRLRGLVAHRLYLGCDENIYIGPRRTLAGMRAAVDVIRLEADRLGVPMRQVVPLGASMGGVCSIFIGLAAGAGTIVSGGPPVRMGSQLKRFTEIDGPLSATKAAAGEFLALADDGGPVDPATWLNRMIFERVAATTTSTDIHVFVSRTDRTFPAVRDLAQAVAGHPSIDLTIHSGDYDRHGHIQDPFYAFTRGLLGAPSASSAA